MYIVDINNSKLMNTIELQQPTLLVRCFDELPDVIFTAVQDPASKSHFLMVMFPENTSLSSEPHAGPITDIYYMVMNGQRIVFTACQDGNIRAFTFKEDNSIEKQLVHPVQNAFATRFIKGSDTFLICCLSSGNFLGW
jgi:hypothetical protein